MMTVWMHIKPERRFYIMHTQPVVKGTLVWLPTVVKFVCLRYEMFNTPKKYKLTL